MAPKPSPAGPARSGGGQFAAKAGQPAPASPAKPPGPAAGPPAAASPASGPGAARTLPAPEPGPRIARPTEAAADVAKKRGRPFGPQAPRTPKAAPDEAAPPSRAEFATRIQQWSELIAGYNAAELRLTHAEARQVADSLIDACESMGWQPRGATWKLLSAIGALIAIFTLKIGALRTRRAAEAAARALPSPRAAAPPVAQGAQPPMMIRPAPGAPSSAPAPSPAPGLPTNGVPAHGGEGTTGAGIPGMPVMTFEERMAPPP